MLNKFISRNLLINNSRRSFAALNSANLENALKDPAHLNWSQFFSANNAADVSDSDVRTVGKLIRVLAYNEDVNQSKDLANAVEEYFKKRYRTL